MRITFLLPTVGWSGGIRVAAIHAHWLAQRGHEVLMVSHEATKPPFRRRVRDWMRGRGWSRHVPRPRSHLDDLPLEHRVLPSGQPWSNQDLPVADILVCTWWETAEAAAHLPADRGARVYFVQGHEVFDYLPRARCEATYRLPFHKIVVSRWLAYVMGRHYGDTRVDVVPNGVDHRRFYAEPRRKQLRPTVGFLWHESHLKRTDLVLDAIAALRRTWPDLRAVAFGASGPRDARAADAGVELHVSPPQDRIRDLYASCDVWLSASQSEGFNLVAMEAMACRTPVVSTATGWPAEAIQDGVNGYCVPIDDGPALVAAARRVLAASDAVWRSMSLQAFNTVKDAGWETSCRCFEAALRHALERSERGEIAGGRTMVPVTCSGRTG